MTGTRTKVTEFNRVCNTGNSICNWWSNGWSCSLSEHCKKNCCKIEIRNIFSKFTYNILKRGAHRSNSSVHAIRKVALTCFPLLRNYLCSYTGVPLMICDTSAFYASIMHLYHISWLNCYAKGIMNNSSGVTG